MTIRDVLTLLQKFGIQINDLFENTEMVINKLLWEIEFSKEDLANRITAIFMIIIIFNFIAIGIPPIKRTEQKQREIELILDDLNGVDLGELTSEKIYEITDGVSTYIRNLSLINDISDLTYYGNATEVIIESAEYLSVEEIQILLEYKRVHPKTEICLCYDVNQLKCNISMEKDVSDILSQNQNLFSFKLYSLSDDAWAKDFDPHKIYNINEMEMLSAYRYFLDAGIDEQTIDGIFPDWCEEMEERISKRVDEIPIDGSSEMERFISLVKYLVETYHYNPHIDGPIETLDEEQLEIVGRKNDESVTEALLNSDAICTIYADTSTLFGGTLKLKIYRIEGSIDVNSNASDHTFNCISFSNREMLLFDVTILDSHDFLKDESGAFYSDDKIEQIIRKYSLYMDYNYHKTTYLPSIISSVPNTSEPLRVPIIVTEQHNKEVPKSLIVYITNIICMALLYYYTYLKKKDHEIKK